MKQQSSKYKKDRFKSEYDIIIIGGGIGGLLTAANLVQKGIVNGQNICLIERLGFLGGRFTSIPNNGYEISTGALHLLPHGNSGPMGKMLNRLINQPVSNLTQSYFSRKTGEKVQLKRAIQSYMGSVLKDWFKVVSATAKYLKDGRPSDISALTYLTEVKTSEEYITHLEKFTNFSLSLHLDEISAYHLGHVFRNSMKYWKPGLLLGGCGHVTTKLVELLEAGGVDVMTGFTVREVLTQDGGVTGILVSPTVGTDKEDNSEGEILEIKVRKIVSDIGQKSTAGLLPKSVKNGKDKYFFKNLKNIHEARGFKFYVKVKKIPVKDAGVVFPLHTSRIYGWTAVSNVDKTLAPPGKNLVIAHGVIESGNNNMKKELDAGISDLEQITGPDFEFEDILSMGTFKDNWPVNRAKQGDDVGYSTPINGLYLVGDGCKPVGYSMAEDVAESVKLLLKHSDIMRIKF